MQVVLAILYMLAGSLLAIPYCFLAGWNAENLPIVAFVAPAFLFIWFILAAFAGVADHGHPVSFNWRAAFHKSDRRELPGSLTVFWAWTIYSFLPVIIHWSAVLLKKIGYETVGSFIDIHRYASPLYVLIAAIMMLILIMMVTSALSTAKNVWTRFVHR